MNKRSVTATVVGSLGTL